MSFSKQEKAIVVWLSGVSSEVSYWQSRILNVRDKDKHSLDDIVSRNKNARHFSLGHLLTGRATVKILDVGSGPVSIVGDQQPGMEIILHACDPLASLYNLVMSHAKITPYVKTDFALGEKLLERYQPESFDLVNMRNALDHSFDPFLVVQNMLAVCKTGGIVYLAHHENNAQLENYEGLHQWNITTNKNGQLVFWNLEKSINITQELAHCALITCEKHQPVDNHPTHWITAKLEKTCQINPATSIVSYYDEIVHKILFYCLLSAKNRKLYQNEYNHILPMLYQKEPGIIKKTEREIKRLGKQIIHLFGKKAK